SELLEPQSPLRLVLLEPNNPKLDSLEYSLTIKRKQNSYIIEDHENGVRAFSLGQKVDSPLGPIMLLQQGNKELESDLLISYIPVNKSIDDLLLAIQIAPNKEKQSFVVNFSMNSGNIKKAELILNSLIDQYNKDMMDDKTRIS